MAAASPEREPESDVVVPRRRTWPVFAAMLLVAALLAFFVIRASRAPKPLRVLVAIDVQGYWWEGSAPAAKLADKLGARLGALGFDVVRAGDPEVTRTLEKAKSPEDAARALHAAFVVTARVPPEVIEHALPSGAYYESRGEADVTVHHVDRPPASAGKIVGFSGARDKARSVELLAEGLADQAFDVVLPKIMGDASIQELLSDRQSNLAPAIFPARDYLLQREHHTKRAHDEWERVRKDHLAKEQGKVKPTYLSAPGAHDELAAAMSGGALVSTNDVRPFYLPDAKRLGWINELESLELRMPDGASKSLWRGYNLYGYPHGANGRAVLVEDLFGWAKTITVVDEKGPRRVKIDPSHRFVDPRISPDGGLVAVWDRECPTCPASLLVLSTKDGSERYLADREAGSFEGFAWLDASHLLFLHTSSSALDDKPEGKLWVEKQDAHMQALHVVDFGAMPPVVEGMLVPKDERYGFPAPSPKGDFVVFERLDGKPSFATWERATKSFGSRDTGGFARAPSIAPDSASIVFVRDDEIAVMPSAGGEVRMLTKNPFRDRYPVFSGDSARVFYETVEDDPNWPEHRSVSWIAMVPAAP